MNLSAETLDSVGPDPDKLFNCGRLIIGATFSPTYPQTSNSLWLFKLFGSYLKN